MAKNKERREFIKLLASMEDLMKLDVLYTFKDGRSSMKSILNSTYAILKDVFQWAGEMADPEEFLCAYIEKHISIIQNNLSKGRRAHLYTEER